MKKTPRSQSQGGQKTAPARTPKSDEQYITYGREWDSAESAVTMTEEVIQQGASLELAQRINDQNRTWLPQR
jgi:hypothetical protein